MRTSSARIKHVAKQARINMIHGFVRRATIIMEKGHPCGVPQGLRCDVPTPPARQLYSKRFKDIAVWCDDAGGHPSEVGVDLIDLMDTNWQDDLPAARV